MAGTTRIMPYFHSIDFSVTRPKAHWHVHHSAAPVERGGGIRDHPTGLVVMASSGTKGGSYLIRTSSFLSAKPVSLLVKSMIHHTKIVVPTFLDDVSAAMLLASPVISLVPNLTPER